VTLAHPTPILVNSSQTHGAGDAPSSASGRSLADIGARGRLSRSHNNVMTHFLSGHRLERSAANALFIGIRYQAAPFGRLILG
jgi:hypothetical protein